MDSSNSSKRIGIVVNTIVLLLLITLLVVYYFKIDRDSTVYLQSFSEMLDSYIENRVGVVTELSKEMTINGVDYSQHLRIGPNFYLHGISIKGYSLKYVFDENDKLVLLEIPISMIKFPVRDFKIIVEVGGRVVYSSDKGLVGNVVKHRTSLGLADIVTKTEATKYGFFVMISPNPSVFLSNLSITFLIGFVPLIALGFLNNINASKEKDLEKAATALRSIVSDMILRVETGEYVEYEPIETKHLPLLKVQDAIYNLFTRYTEAIAGYKSTTEELENTMAQIEEMQSALEERNFLLINTLAETVELKDIGTGEHSKKVMQLSLALATKLGITDPEELNAIKYGAILHDIGKIGIPDQILLKQGKLTAEEFEVMKSHTILGERVVSQIPGWELVADIVRHHHENIDGSGYPDGLSKGTLSLRAQIVSIVDVFTALTEDRPYRNALTPKEALELMESMVGKKFDTELFGKFKEVIAEQLELVSFLENVNDEMGDSEGGYPA
ncbi:HDIG domain-containing protein [Fervidobacterium changbaicum]|uniref:HD-GYP domain-containing protein n=1 Tax=Fervidobacterium changbaicum TaxID=310769 RepID=A0ABX5QQ16_9BACT|nr:HD-GYP domain-containing protein [Fervidobacterium changbaicum]QAV32556.1 HD-GYP domain-containing protein [Fervidobacterium changbaicum]SDH85232.1 HDIG domain-containing protein [Fervidobacterium changbaicum]